MTLLSSTVDAVGASFRDPSGRVIRQDGVIYRVIHATYQAHYRQLMDSGLYAHLVAEGLLIPHEPCGHASFLNDVMGSDACDVIKPVMIPFISYPYEWCFSQLKDAALTTLAIQQQALQFGMVLKDANAYNIQFYEGRPVLIDTLSFEPYDDTKPWIAYQQFCQQFLAPLLLMAYRDVRLNQLSKLYLDGIPLDLASRLLPWSTYLQWPILVHIHWHSRSHMKRRDASLKHPPHFSRFKMLALLDSLTSGIQSLRLPRRQKTPWANYYQQAPYTETALAHKKTLVAQWIDMLQPATLWDMGANTGVLSRLGSHRPLITVAMDSDPLAVEANYHTMKQRQETHILPLWQDLTNPSGAIGWDGMERDALQDRGPVDLVMALALMHHLVMTHHIPVDLIVDFFASLGRFLILEFVPKSDDQVRQLLAHRPHHFMDYTPSSIEAAFSRRFSQEQVVPIHDSERVLYLFKRKD